MWTPKPTQMFDAAINPLPDDQANIGPTQLVIAPHMVVDWARSLGLALLTAVGFGLLSTVLDNSNNTWAGAAVLVVAVGVSPIVAGWTSPFRMYFVLFPVGISASVYTAGKIFGPTLMETPLDVLAILTGLVYGGIASIAFFGGWFTRQYLGRFGGTKFP